VETAVEKLKICKAAGPGNIPAVLLKNASQKLYKMIAQLFTGCAYYIRYIFHLIFSHSNICEL